MKKNVKNNKKNNKKGFTMVELLGVMVMLGVLATVAVPAVTHFVNRARTRSVDTMKTSAYEATTSVMVDKGISIPSGKYAYFSIGGYTGPILGKLNASNLKQFDYRTEAPKKISDSGALYKGDLVSLGYMEQPISPYDNETPCKGYVVVDNKGSNAVGLNGIDNYVYRVYLQCRNEVKSNKLTNEKEMLEVACFPEKDTSNECVELNR